MTLSTIQEFPNRVNSSGNKAVVGSTTGVDANDPVVAAHDGTHYVYTPGVSGNWFTVPDEAALDITGDIDIRAQVALVDWSPSTEETLLSRHLNTGGERSWWFSVVTGGELQLRWSTDGSSGATVTETSTAATGITDGDTSWVRATLDVDNGAGGYDLDFYTSTDGVTWTPLGTTVTGGSTTSIYAGTAVLGVGGTETSGGGNALTGSTFRAMVLDGIAGTTVLDINPAINIDTSSDPDAGQSTFTATTGQTVTVNRTTSGLVTAVVTRPVALFDGSACYLQLPAEDTPTFTKTAGKHTVVVAFRRPFTGAGTDKLWSSESGADNGAALLLSGASLIARAGDGTPVSTAAGTVTVGALEVGALVADDGDLYGYLYGGGLSTPVAMSGIAGTITHESTPRWGSRANSVTHLYEGETFELLTFHNQALTEDQLDTLAATLVSGDYT